MQRELRCESLRVLLLGATRLQKEATVGWVFRRSKLDARLKEEMPEDVTPEILRMRREIMGEILAEMAAPFAKYKPPESELTLDEVLDLLKFHLRAKGG